jgi:hypothetical protein
MLTGFEESLYGGKITNVVLDSDKDSEYNTDVLGATPRSTSVRENP